MKVLVLSPHFSEYAICLARALAQRPDISVLLVLNESNFRSEVGGSPDVHSLRNLEIILLPHRRSLGRLVLNTWHYLRIIREFRPDVIHAQEEPKDYLVFSLMLTFRPVVVTIHDPSAHNGDSTTSKRFSRRDLYRRYLRHRAKGAVVHGNCMLEDLRRQGFNKVAISAPHGPLGILLNQPAHEWIAGRCLFFGRMQSYKGLDEFIQAVESVAVDHPDVQGVIAGRGPELTRLRGMLQGNTRFSVIEKFLSPTEVLQQFRKSNVVVLPYREATQSGVAAFALGVGRPMVVTRVGSLPEVVDHGRNGFIVPPRQALALAGAVSSILADPQLAAMMGEHSLTMGKGRLSWDTAAIATIALYDHLRTRK